MCKETLLMNVCYSFHGEPANDMKISWIVTSLWVNRQENKLHLGQESHTGIALLLLLSGGIELCPGSGMKSQETYIGLRLTWLSSGHVVQQQSQHTIPQ